MKFPRLLIICLAMWATRSLAVEPSVNVHWQVGEIRGDGRMPSDTRRLLNNPKVDLVRPPAFKIKSGQVGEASVTRDLGEAPDSPMRVGIYLYIRPTLAGERIEYSVDSKRIEFLGHSPGKRNLYEIARRTGMGGSVASGKTVLFDLGVREDSAGRLKVKRRLVAILTFSRA